MCLCVCTCMYVSMYMYVCMFVCIYVCMYIKLFMYVDIYYVCVFNYVKSACIGIPNTFVPLLFLLLLAPVLIVDFYIDIIMQNDNYL